jgi:SHS2 domain-containing protein
VPWVELPHTADAGLEITASSVEDLVTEAAWAFYAFMFGEVSLVRSVEEHTVELECMDLLELFVSWLNELLYIYDTKEKVFSPETIEVDPKRARLLAKGNLHIAPSPARAVKAVTYGGAEISEGPPWRLRVYLDL